MSIQIYIERCPKCKKLVGREYVAMVGYSYAGVRACVEHRCVI